MRLIRPVETENLAQLSPVVWRGNGGDGAFILEPVAALRFVCIFLQVDTGHAAPKVAFDRGDGFDEASALSFRAFPFGFYHISLAGMTAVRRLRFRACLGTGTFRCFIFQTARPVPVGVLHYLFNLRYRNVSVIAASVSGAGWRAALATNIACFAPSSPTCRLDEASACSRPMATSSRRCSAPSLGSPYPSPTRCGAVSHRVPTRR